MTLMWTNAIQMKNWLQQVREDLRARGYYYELAYCNAASGADSLVTAAKLLGDLYVPPGTEDTRPFIPTKPQSSAPPWRPFDRRKPIRWHNDFSTRAGRPELSLSWLLREDPNGSNHGAWWVASSADVVANLCRSSEGKRLVAKLREQAQPFGYRDAGSWRKFRVIAHAGSKSLHNILRFYGPALEDGAWLRFGNVPESTKDIVARIEEAADAVRIVLPAKKGSLLIVHNGLSLHDRSAQTVTGPKELRRQALLCFVKRLHQAL
jgi:hypothetical protein